MIHIMHNTAHSYSQNQSLKLPSTKKYLHKLIKLINKQSTVSSNSKHACSNITILLLISGVQTQHLNTTHLQSSNLTSLDLSSTNYNLHASASLTLPIRMYAHMCAQKKHPSVNVYTPDTTFTAPIENATQNFSSKTKLTGTPVSITGFTGTYTYNVQPRASNAYAHRPHIFEISHMVAHCVLKLCDLTYSGKSKPNLHWSLGQLKKNSKGYNSVCATVLGALVVLNTSNVKTNNLTQKLHTLQCNPFNSRSLEFVTTHNVSPHVYFLSADEIAVAFSCMDTHHPARTCTTLNTKFKKYLKSTKNLVTKTTKMLGRCQVRRLCNLLTKISNT